VKENVMLHDPSRRITTVLQLKECKMEPLPL
jgi:hypothetical protein